MDLKKLLKIRIILGKICVFAGILAMAGISDGLITAYRNPTNSFDMVAGYSLDINGKLFGNAKSVKDLGYEKSSSDINIAFDEKLYSGFWFGEGMWRAVITADKNIKPGNYRISIKYPDLRNIKQKYLNKIEKMSNFSINVYEDQQALRRGAKSIITRYAAISPWAIFAAFFPILIIATAISYLISNKIEELMIEIGQAEIYRVTRVEKGFEIYFGLGKKHGVEKGDILDLLNDEGAYIAKIEVENGGIENSTALVGVYRDVKPGYLVARSEG